MMRRVLVLEHDDSLCLFILAKSGTAGTARLGQGFCPFLSRVSELRTPACSPHSSSSLQRNKTFFLSIKNCYLFLHRICWDQEEAKGTRSVEIRNWGRWRSRGCRGIFHSVLKNILTVTVDLHLLLLATQEEEGRGEEEAGGAGEEKGGERKFRKRPRWRKKSHIWYTSTVAGPSKGQKSLFYEYYFYLCSFYEYVLERRNVLFGKNSIQICLSVSEKKCQATVNWKIVFLLL